MQIFVINLKNASERRKAVQEQIEKLGFDVRFVEAINGKSLNNDYLNRCYRRTKFYRINGRYASQGEIGCALSHLETYKTIINEDLSHALILEDDVWLNPDLRPVLNELEELLHPRTASIVLLTWAIRIYTGRTKQLTLGYRLASAPRVSCAHGYVITNEAARRLVNFLQPIHQLADDWARIGKYGVTDVKCVYPAIITNVLQHKSQVASANSDAEKLTFLRWIFFRIPYRLFWLCADNFRALIHRIINNVN